MYDRQRDNHDADAAEEADANRPNQLGLSDHLPNAVPAVRVRGGVRNSRVTGSLPRRHHLLDRGEQRPEHRHLLRGHRPTQPARVVVGIRVLGDIVCHVRHLNRFALSKVHGDRTDEGAGGVRFYHRQLLNPEIR